MSIDKNYQEALKSGVNLQNEIRLTQLFVAYAETKVKLESLAKEITEAVLLKAETVKMAGITATFYKPGTETPDYEGALARYLGEHPEAQEQIEMDYTTIIRKIKAKEACQAFGLEVGPGEERPARVVIK